MAAAGGLMVLVACGRGGHADAAVSDQGAPVRIAGVVARGGALVAAEVTARCVSGPAVVTTSGSGGAYAVEVEASALPCLLRAVSADGAWTLHSAAIATPRAATTPTVTAHITPLTELLVAQLTGAAPSIAMAQATSHTLRAALAPHHLAAGHTAVARSLSGLGMDAEPITDALAQPLVAASAVQRGNAHDKVLETLSTSLARTGATLADLVGQVTGRSRAMAAVRVLPQEPLGAGQAEQ
jgi:hypothetical protein